MNEQLQTALADLITKSIRAIESGGEFLSGQIPDVINQLLLWDMVYYFILFLIGVGICLATVVFNLKQYRYWKWVYRLREGTYQDGLGDHPEIILNLIQLLIIPILLTCTLNLNWLKIWLAPKVYLIEYAKTFIK